LRFSRRARVDGHQEKENSLEFEVPRMALEGKNGLTHENTTGKRRSRMRIIADILRHAQRPAKQTHVMYECNLSFSQLKRYLIFLKTRALIRRNLDTGSIIYQTTNNGQEFLRRYSSIARLLRSPELKRS